MGRTGFGGCTPIIQTYGEEPSFLPKHPLELWSDPAYVGVPAMYGTNKHEGTYVMASEYTITTQAAGYFKGQIIIIHFISVMYGNFLKPNNLTEDENFLSHDMMPVILNLFGKP